MAFRHLATAKETSSNARRDEKSDESDLHTRASSDKWTMDIVVNPVLDDLKTEWKRDSKLLTVAERLGTVLERLERACINECCPTA